MYMYLCISSSVSHSDETSCERGFFFTNPHVETHHREEREGEGKERGRKLHIHACLLEYQNTAYIPKVGINTTKHMIRKYIFVYTHIHIL